MNVEQLKSKVKQYKYEIAAGSAVAALLVVSGVLIGRHTTKQPDTFDPDVKFEPKDWIQIQISKDDMLELANTPDRAWYSTDRKPYIQVAVKR